MATVNDDRTPLDADVCDEMIVQFRERLQALQRDAVEVRRQFDRLHARWLAHIENRNGGAG